MVCSLREGFGFIRCVERENTMFFHFAEVLRLGHELSVGDEVSLWLYFLKSSRGYLNTCNHRLLLQDSSGRLG